MANQLSSEYYDTPTASIDSQILGRAVLISDSTLVQSARAQINQYDGYISLGQALSRQFRYREAIQAYSDALLLRPNDRNALRLRAGRYLSTLQAERSLIEFQHCIDLGADLVDCLYRMGLAYYYLQQYENAALKFEECMPLCNDEMGIAVIYWHTICAQRMGKELSLLASYHLNMAVGHHTAYEKVMRMWSGSICMEQLIEAAEREPDDMEYSILLYGAIYHPLTPSDQSTALLRRILARDRFWPSFAFLTAWNDYMKR